MAFRFAAALAERAVLLDKVGYHVGYPTVGRIIADGDAKKIMCDSQLMTEHGLEVPSRIK